MTQAAPTAKPDRRRAYWIGGSIALFIAVILACEWAGWPFLAKPMQRWVSGALQRPVKLGADPADPEARVYLLGRLRLAANYIEIGAPAWSDAPPTLVAHEARLTLRYLDLWRASRGDPLRIHELRAARLEGHVERLADGRASWQFGDKKPETDPSQPVKVPEFGRLQVDQGTVVYRDAILDAELDARFSLIEGQRVAAGSGAASAASASRSALPSSSAAASASAPSVAAAASAASGPTTGLVLEGKGTYRNLPFRVDAHTVGVLPIVGTEAASFELPVTLHAEVGGATLEFIGTTTDVVQLAALSGRFEVKGTSLGAAGRPFGLTLPTTGPFQIRGLIAKDGAVWNAVVDRAAIGSSQLEAAFRYDPRSGVPVLSGRLGGARLQLADLGPAVGATPRSTTAAAKPGARASAARAKTDRSSTNRAKAESAASARSASKAPAGKADGARRVLPSRAFDLPSLRAMNANVVIDIASLDLGSGLLEAIKPFRAHLVLRDGVLTLRDIDARTGAGTLAGSLRLDGRNQRALWTTDLRWDRIRLERFVRQERSGDAPPYLTGTLNGRARVSGQGRSTAEILGSLKGEVRMQIANGTVSHLAIEAIGLDVAQGLGMLFKGDESLRLQCNVIDLVAEKGLFKPRAFVLDTRDSTVFVDGTLSLATEAMDLRVVVTPKDFSPLALRTPLRLTGTFGDPDVSVEMTPLATRLGAAVLLALINPVAAVLPFIDTGDAAVAKQGAEECRALSARMKARPGLPAP